ncbi:MAG: zinc ribbon domain-containing protein [Methanoregula sp.]
MRLPGSKKKKTISCPRCNSPMPEGAAFCDACGARIAPPPACSLCGTLLEPGARFCPSCGSMIGKSKDNQPMNTGLPDEKPAPEKRSRQPRAKKPKPDENAGSAATAEKTPDPLMMIPEDPVPVAAPAETEPSSLLAKKSPSRSALITIPPAGNKSQGLLSGPGRKKTVLIAGIVIIIVGALLIFSGILHSIPPGTSVDTSTPADSGVENPEPEATVTPVTITTNESDAIAVTTTETYSLVPGPTQVPPDTFMVYFTAERDPRSKIVSVQYMGGKGQYGVRDVFVRLTRSDGEVLTGTFKPTQAGSGVEFQGTEKVDRIEVIARYHTGAEYTIIDKIFEYKIRT